MEYNYTRFEVLEDYKDKDIQLPQRGSPFSAGYDIRAAEDIIIPSIIKTVFSRIEEDSAEAWSETKPMSIEAITKYNKEVGLKATLIPTGLCIYLQPEQYLAIVPRSGIATKTLLSVPNSPATIDSDYYPNHIMIPMINHSPYDILIKKGERIAQGIILDYGTVDTGEEFITEERKSGFGSSGVK